MLKAIRQVGRFIVRDPAYLLGRFRSVRRVHSRVQWAIRPRHGPLEIGPLWATSGIAIERADSGLVRSDHSTEVHCQRLDRQAWSDGIRLTPEAVAALRAFARESPIAYCPARGENATAERLGDLSPETRASTTTAVLSADHENDIVRQIAGDPAIVDVIE